MRLAAATLAVLLATSCARPLPTGALSAAQVQDARHRPGEALWRYLAQEDADPAVCDLHRSPAVPWVNARVVRQLGRAYDTQMVPPQAYAGCMLHLWRTVDPVTWDALVDSVLARIRAAADADLDGHPDALDRARALGTILNTRDGARPLPKPVVLELAAHLRRRRAHLADGPAARFVDGLIEDLEVEIGVHDGQPITPSSIAITSDERTLLSWARRLPQDDGLRLSAKQRLIDLRIERSPFEVLRRQPAIVRQSVLDLGYWPVPDDASVLSAAWEGGSNAPAVVRVLQDEPEKGPKLRMARADRTETPDGALQLRHTLWAAVQGYPEPISTCPGSDAFDPTPCLPVERLSVTSPIARVTDDARLAFRERIPMAHLLEVVRSGERVRLQLVIEQGPVIDFDFGLHFDPVPPLVLRNRGYGSDGPDLEVAVSELSAARLLWQVTRDDQNEPIPVVVPRTDAGFAVISAGSPGSPGSPGSTGSSGASGHSGSPASCPGSPGGNGGNGQPGGTGGSGGPGGNGGDGGDVHVVLRCDHCSTLKTTIERAAQSRAGPGGQGGQGGAGGQGGSGGMGGSGTSCTTTDWQGNTQYRSVSGGSSGMAGSQGARGSNGPHGSSGKAGEVTIEVR